MINFDSLILKLFVRENEGFFTGARIQKIRQPSRTELVISLRNNGESRNLYININPLFYHLCFMSDENMKKRNISYPKTAPMFCMLLRKYLQNAKIVKVSVPAYERIFEIYIEYFDEFNGKSLLCLAVELMGKYSNVILYNYDNNVIIGTAHNVSSQKSRERELCGMLPYVYPRKQRKKNIINSDKEYFLKVYDSDSPALSVSSSFYYLTAPLVRKFMDCYCPENPESLYIKLKNFLKNEEFTPAMQNDYSAYFPYNFPDLVQYDSYNALLDDYYAYHQAEYIKNNLKSKILKYIDSRLEKLITLKDKYNERILNTDKGAVYKKTADIITANLYNIPAGCQNLQLPDFEGNITDIELDTTIFPSENAKKYYALYKKNKSAAEHALLLLQETNSEIRYFEEQKFFVQNTSGLNDLNCIYASLFPEESGTESIKEEKNVNLDCVDYEGAKIFIGKNQKQNDYILSKVSSGEDIWFHVLNGAGAHILVKMRNPKSEISDSIILKAAILTKEYSGCKSDSKTCVIYTKRKYVKKAKGKTAFVTYKNETEITV